MSDLTERIDRFCQLVVDDVRAGGWQEVFHRPERMKKRWRRIALRALKDEPAGWVLCPKEPTEEMIAEGSDAGSIMPFRAAAAYKAMIAALPVPEQQPQGDLAPALSGTLPEQKDAS